MGKAKLLHFDFGMWVNSRHPMWCYAIKRADVYYVRYSLV